MSAALALALVPLSGCDAATPAVRAAVDASATLDGGDAPDAALDATTLETLDAAATVNDGGAGEDGATVPFDAALAPEDATGPLARCDTFPATIDVCGATASECNVVFHGGLGCTAACASAGMTCRASYRDHDSVTPARCAIDPSGESYGCSDTGHTSDYCVCGAAAAREVAFPGAEGFGAYAEGGRGGTVYTVTNLNDSGEGSLRWAVERSGRRIVQFAVDGVIRLRSELDISDPYLTIDGRGALDPGEAGITIRDHTVNIRTHDVVLRYFRVRLGDSAVLARVRASGLSRPTTSDDLDCINIDHASDVILDHLSTSWSTDEIVSVTNSRNITVQWTILSEPLSNPMAHPYGDNHAFCANNSAATLTYHHDLFAHYVFRGPQFEANDMRESSPHFDAQFEAVNNVMYGFESSGSRYRPGFEAGHSVSDVEFDYHFVRNRYINADGSRSEIMADTSDGIAPNVHLYVEGNLGPHRSSGDDELALVFTDSHGSDPLRGSSAERQVSRTPLFVSPVPVTTTSADVARDAVFADAGCSIERDAIDARVIADARARRATAVVHSQEDVPGGWPSR